MGATTTAKLQVKRFDVTDKNLADLLLHTLRGQLVALNNSLGEKSRELSMKSDKLRIAYNAKVKEWAFKVAGGAAVKRVLGKSLAATLKFDPTSIGYYPPKRITLSFINNSLNFSEPTEPIISKSAVQLDIPYPTGHTKHNAEIEEIEARNAVVCKRKDKVASLLSNSSVSNNSNMTFLESEVWSQVIRWKLSKLKDDGIDFDPVALSEAFIKEKLG
jgi:hypothetical protein